jgi:hypothetical protein
MSDLSKRDSFLLAMYSQMWDNIDRHIMVVWQSVGTLAGAFAVSALVEKQVLSLDWAVTVIVLVAAWQVAHTVDAGFWYNRNLAIVSNIERQFLTPNDSADIHPYFAKRRPAKLLDHLKIQFAFGTAVALLVLTYHFNREVWPGVGAPWSTFDFRKAMPYVTFAICCILLLALHQHQTRKYAKDFPETDSSRTDADA